MTRILIRIDGNILLVEDGNSSAKELYQIVEKILPLLREGGKGVGEPPKKLISATAEERITRKVKIEEAGESTSSRRKYVRGDFRIISKHIYNYVVSNDGCPEGFTFSDILSYLMENKVYVNKPTLAVYLSRLVKRGILNRTQAKPYRYIPNLNKLRKYLQNIGALPIEVEE